MEDKRIAIQSKYQLLCNKLADIKNKVETSSSLSSALCLTTSNLDDARQNIIVALGLACIYNTLIVSDSNSKSSTDYPIIDEIKRIKQYLTKLNEIEGIPGDNDDDNIDDGSAKHESSIGTKRKGDSATGTIHSEKKVKNKKKSKKAKL